MSRMHPDQFFGRYREAPPAGAALASADTRKPTAPRTASATRYHVRDADGCRVLTVLRWNAGSTNNPDLT